MREIVSRLRKCVEDYKMITKGDRIAVGVSGGKDSLVCLCALAEISRYYAPFTIEAITLDMGFEGVDFSAVNNLCDRLGVRHTVIRTQLKQIIFDIRKESNPCSLCAKMRRGALHDAALSLGCKKIALGHHQNDAAETLLMSLLYEGRIACFSPVTYLDRKDITLIRPLIYADERQIRRAAYTLPVIHNPCPANGNSKRSETKALIASLEKDITGLNEKLVGAMQRLPLAGWGKE